MPVIFRASLREQLDHQMNLKNDAIDECVRLRARVAELEYANASLETTCSAHCTVIAELEARDAGFDYDLIKAERDRCREALQMIADNTSCYAGCSNYAYDVLE